MIKKIVALMMIFALFPIASALSEGQILTQQQVDNFPIENYDTINSLVGLLECQKYDGFNFLWKRNWFYVKPFSCYQLDPIVIGESYVIKTEKYFARFRIDDYVDCIKTFDNRIPLNRRIEFCDADYTQRLRDYGKNKIFKIKDEIISYQGLGEPSTSFNGTYGGDLF